MNTISGKEDGILLKKTISGFFAVIFIFAAAFSISVCAAPTDTYTHTDIQGGNTDLQLSRELYTAVKTISAGGLQLDNALSGITDICTASDGSVLLLCGEESRIVWLEANGALRSELTVISSDGTPIDYSGSQGIYCDKNGILYLCDTVNARVLLLDSNGTVIRDIRCPDSELIPEDFMFQPVAVARDSQDYTYILSLGCYYGALMFSPEGSFMGFYGSNTVSSSALDTLSYLWDKLTSNDTKRSASLKKLPYSFVDFTFDADGYLVTCTGKTDSSSNGAGQIRKISPNGANILYKRDPRGGSIASTTLNFLESKMVLQEKNTGKYRAQEIVAVEVSEDNYIFALDSTNGTIYLYDSQCNLLGAFAGGLETGEQLGVFNKPVSTTLVSDDLWVADYKNNSVTVFRPTEYGTLLRKAQTLYLRGDYEEAKPLWEMVLSKDRGNQLAYRGLAMVSYNDGNYSQAKEYARSALDYSVYDLAWKAILSDFFAKNFVWMLLALTLVVGVSVWAALSLKKKKRALIENEEVKLMLTVPFHPFRNYEDLKYRKHGSVKLAILLMLLLYLSFVLKSTVSGFLYTDVAINKYNAIYTLAQTIGLLLLWSVANWLVCSMFSGKGTFREVYISTTYALVPLIIYTFLYTLFSNFLPLSASGFLNGLGTAVWIFTFFLICIAMITVHEYDFFKFLLTGIVVVFFMILAVFVLFMCAILIKQFISFVVSVYEEIAYR